LIGTEDLDNPYVARNQRTPDDTDPPARLSEDVLALCGWSGDNFISNWAQTPTAPFSHATA
jgi:hypothetical protein